MNAIELYKRLPKKNCGKCLQKSCMPFALSVMKGDVELSECPHMTAVEREAMEGSLGKSDWREELLKNIEKALYS